MKHPSTFKASPLLAVLLTVNGALAQEIDQGTDLVALDTVKVSADFRELDLQQIPSAITVVGEDDIQKRNADHLESILSLAPNVNYSAGASRGRYFQIRGIGERSQFVDAVNPSVGLIIDGVDMTGLGGAATLFDVQQVEILRGPQGTAFGANALAGAINIKSKQPTKETEGYVEAEVGNYGKKTLGTAISGALSESVQGRFAINKTLSNGYMENVHLNRNDTNNIDETVARAHLNWQANENNDFSFSLLKADIDNGYDAFSLDNSRTTYSNMPGKDTQETTAFVLNWTSKVNEKFHLNLLASTSESDVTYGFDEDWAYGEYTWLDDEGLDGNGDEIYQPDPCDTSQGQCLTDFDGYSSTDEYIRNYSRSNFDIRLLSTPSSRLFNKTTNWLIGIYNLERKEELTRNYTWDPQFTSDLKQTSTAIYTELSTQLSANTTLTYGVRAEEWTNNYTDSGNLDSDKSEALWGGKVTLESLLNINQLAYISLARGYKAGGVNSNPDISEDSRTFKTETNNTVEFGLKSSLLNDEFTTRLAAFYVQRKDQQVKQSSLYYDNGKPKFRDFFANAAEGSNYGLELEGTWQVTPTLDWEFSLGYLVTEFIDYEFTSKDTNNNIITVDKDGRSQAHAPEFSLASAINVQISKRISIRVEGEAMDEFYFSDSHDEKSKAYALLHASIKYERDNFEISLNGHNLTDKDYAVRGFGFGNDPRNGYSDTQHIQLGAPRLTSLSARYNF